MKYIVLFSLISSISLAQEIASFESILYFQDALGNVDSVIVGHDVAANDNYNPNFGELHVGEAWDSVFEVRAAHFLDWQHPDGDLLLSKKIIGSNEGGFHPVFECLLVNEPIVLFANIKNYPLTVSWNSEDYSTSICRNRSTITPNVKPLISEYWFEFLEQDVDYSCMAESESITFDYFDVNDGFGFYLVDEVEDGTQDTIVAMLLNFRFQNAIDSPCSSIVSTKNDRSSSKTIQVFPNPTSDAIYIDSNFYNHWVLINQKMQFVAKSDSEWIDMSVYQDGVYYLSFFDSKYNLINTEKIVKVE